VLALDAAIEGILRARVEASGSLGIVAGVVDAGGMRRVGAYGEAGDGQLPLDTRQRVRDRLGDEGVHRHAASGHGRAE
jgi:hypothetical protein